MAQMIGAKLHFKAIFGLGVGRDHDAGVVDQQIETTVAFLELCGKFVY